MEVAALDAKAEAVCRLVPEVLLDTQFTDVKAVADLLKQVRLAREREASTIEARNLARRRAASSYSAKGAVDETLSGIAQLRYVQAAEKRFAAEIASSAVPGWFKAAVSRGLNPPEAGK